MAIIYHFANPDIVNIILLIGYIILVIAGIHLKIQKKEVKKPTFFTLSGFLAALWYFVFFFIPAFMFTSPPTIEEIQFTDMYLLVWHELIPGLILIISLGVINIIIGLNNREDYGSYLLISGIIFIISILLDFIVLPIITSIFMTISLLFFLYYSLRIKSIYLAVFCVTFIFSLVFPLIMPDHYIHIF